VDVPGLADVLDVIAVGLLSGARPHCAARDFTDRGSAVDVLAAHSAQGVNVAVRTLVYLVRLLFAAVPAIGIHDLFHFLTSL
jgi:hypothetical protein